MKCIKYWSDEGRDTNYTKELSEGNVQRWLSLQDKKKCTKKLSKGIELKMAESAYVQRQDKKCTKQWSEREGQR